MKKKKKKKKKIAAEAKQKQKIVSKKSYCTKNNLKKSSIGNTMIKRKNIEQNSLEFPFLRGLTFPRHFC